MTIGNLKRLKFHIKWIFLTYRGGLNCSVAYFKAFSQTLETFKPKVVASLNTSSSILPLINLFPFFIIQVLSLS